MNRTDYTTEKYENYLLHLDNILDDYLKLVYDRYYNTPFYITGAKVKDLIRLKQKINEYLNDIDPVWYQLNVTCPSVITASHITVGTIPIYISFKRRIVGNGEFLITYQLYDRHNALILDKTITVNSTSTTIPLYGVNTVTGGYIKLIVQEYIPDFEAYSPKVEKYISISLDDNDLTYYYTQLTFPNMYYETGSIELEFNRDITIENVYSYSDTEVDYTVKYINTHKCQIDVKLLSNTYRSTLPLYVVVRYASGLSTITVPINTGGFITKTFSGYNIVNNGDRVVVWNSTGSIILTRSIDIIQNFEVYYKSPSALVVHSQGYPKVYISTNEYQLPFTIKDDNIFIKEYNGTVYGVYLHTHNELVVFKINNANSTFVTKRYRLYTTNLKILKMTIEDNKIFVNLSYTDQNELSSIMELDLNLNSIGLWSVSGFIFDDMAFDVYNKGVYKIDYSNRTLISFLDLSSLLSNINQIKLYDNILIYGSDTLLIDDDYVYRLSSEYDAIYFSTFDIIMLKTIGNTVTYSVQPQDTIELVITNRWNINNFVPQKSLTIPWNKSVIFYQEV